MQKLFSLFVSVTTRVFLLFLLVLPIQDWEIWVQTNVKLGIVIIINSNLVNAEQYFFLVTGLLSKLVKNKRH